MPDRTAPLGVPSEDVADPSDTPADFGDQEPTRFAADVEYRGRAQGHDYLVRVRHRFLDSSFTVILDGVEHDPKAEEKAARKGRDPEGAADDTEQTEYPAGDSAGPAADDDAPAAPADDAHPTAADAHPAVSPAGDDVAGDGLRFRLEENVTVVHCTVRRPDADGHLADAEVISVRTTGLGGAGEVDVRHGLERTLLVPADDSPSAVRDRKRTAHPTRYALVAALARAAGFLLPLLGLGALLSGLLDPVTEWLGARVRPILDAIAEFFDPVREWIAGVLRPIEEFLDALFAPVRAFLAAILRPLVQGWEWLTDLLLGWIPDLALPFSIPAWVVDVAVPVLVVLAVFAVTFSGLRHRHEKLEATRRATDTATREVHEDATGSPGEGARSSVDGRRDRDDGSTAPASSSDGQSADRPPSSSSRPAQR